MLDNLLIHTITVNRPTPSKGTSGAEKDQYTAVYTGLACLIQPVQAQWQLQYAQRQINITHSIGFNRNVTINNGDQLVFGSRTLMVKGVRNLTEQGKVIVADCQEIT